MSCSAMSGCACLVHVSVAPVASAFYANVVPRIKYKGTTAKDRVLCLSLLRNTVGLWRCEGFQYAVLSRDPHSAR